jgi:sugar lactone lactonase YvrE
MYKLLALFTSAYALESTCVWSVTTFAGGLAAGAANGVGTTAQFSKPERVAVNASGTLYVSDTGNALIRQVTPGGSVSLLAGGATGSSVNADGVGTNVGFKGPIGLALNSSGSLFIADTLNHKIRFAPTTLPLTVTSVMGSGTASYGPGKARIMSFSKPNDVVADNNGFIYIVDSTDNMIRKADLATFTASDFTVRLNSILKSPTSLVLDTTNTNNLGYVADQGNNCIRLVTKTGQVSTLAGSCSNTTSGSVDGLGTSALFTGPSDLTFTAEGNLIVADTGNSAIRLINMTTLAVSTIAGKAKTLGSSNGVGSAALFNYPKGVTYDPVSSSFYVSDTENHAIRRLTCVPGSSFISPSPTSTPTLTPSGTPSPANTLGGGNVTTPTPTPCPTFTPSSSPTTTPTTTKGGVGVAPPSKPPRVSPSPSLTPSPTKSATTLSSTPSKNPNASALGVAPPSPSRGSSSSSSATLSSGGIGGVVAGVLLLAIIGGVVAFCTLCQKVKASPLGGPQDHQHHHHHQQQHVDVVQVVSSPNPLVFQQQPQPSAVVVMPPAQQQQQQQQASTIVITNAAPPAPALHPTHAAVAFGLPMVAVHHHHSSGSGGDGGGALPPGWQSHSDGTDTWYTDPSGNSHWEAPRWGGGGVGTMC